MTGDNDSPQPPGDGPPQAGPSSNPPDFKGLSEAATQLAKNVTKAAQPFRELTDRLCEQFGRTPELSSFAQQLAEQQEAIGRFLIEAWQRKFPARLLPKACDSET